MNLGNSKINFEFQAFSSSTCTDAESWISKYELFSRLNRWKDEDKVDMLELFMDGKDLLWYKRKRTEIADWKNAKELFIEKFDGKDAEIRAWSELQTLKQEDFKDFDEFEAEFSRLLLKAKVLESNIQMKFLLSAVEPKYRKVLIRNNIKDFQDAISAIQKEEELEKMISPSIQKSLTISKEIKQKDKKIVKTHKTEDQEELYEALISKFDKLSLNIMNVLETMQRSGDKPKREYSQETLERIRKGECFYCHKIGHVKTECPKWIGKSRELGCLDMDTNDKVDLDELLAVEKRQREHSDYVQAKDNRIRKVQKSNMGSITESIVEDIELPFEMAPIAKQKSLNLFNESLVKRESQNKDSIPDRQKESEELENSQKRSKGMARIRKKHDIQLGKTTVKYSIKDELEKIFPNINLAQLLYASPLVRKELTDLFKKIDSKELGLMVNEKIRKSNCRAIVEIFGKHQWSIIDTGAACSVITLDLLGKLGLDIDSDVSPLVVTADGTKHETLGMVSDVPIKIAGQVFPAKMLVMRNATNSMVLGTDWLNDNNALIDFKSKELVLPLTDFDVVLSITIESKKTLESDDTYEYYALAKEERNVVSSTDSMQLIDELIGKYQDIFVNDISELKQTDVTTHSIDTGTSNPVKVRPYRIPHHLREQVRDELRIMEKNGIIEQCQSEWCAPIVVVMKKNGKLRICSDYRKLNLITRKDAYPLPIIDDILAVLGGAVVFSVLDAVSGFWQVRMNPEDKHKTAFALPGDGMYCYNVMPFGLCNSPATFQKLMEKVLAKAMWKYAIVFVDDIIIYSSSIEQHKIDLENVFQMLREGKIQLHQDKCEYYKDSVNYLGYTISAKGIATNKSKIEAIKSSMDPRNVKEIQSFLGLTGYYRKFIQNYSSIAKPLTELLKKGKKWEWTTECNHAVSKLKDSLMCAPTLAHPNWNFEFILTTDASTSGLGAILSQNINCEERPVAFASRTINKHEANYSITHLEGLGVIYGIKKFKHYLWGRKFIVRTDHMSLLKVFESTELSGRVARWAMFLRDFDFEFEHCKGSTNPSDYLSRLTENKPKYASRPQKVDIGTMDILYYHAIKDYLSEFKYPLGADDEFRKKLRNKARLYKLLEGKLYKNSKQLGLREVLNEHNAKEIIHEVHCEGHEGINNTWNRVKNKYIGSGLFQIVKDVVSECDHCQKYLPGEYRRNEMIPILATKPFQIIGIDAVGPISPISKEGNRYILTAIDYLTKWPVAVAVSNIQSETVVSFLLTKIVQEFGVPKQIITDRGSNFVGEMTTKLYQALGIRHTPATAYRPQTNGQVERMHRTFKNIIAKMCVNNQDNWDGYIWKTLLVIRTMNNSSTGLSPAEMIYGCKLNTPSTWVTDGEINNIEEEIQRRIEEIKFISEIREYGIEKMTKAKSIMKKRYDAMVRTYKFKVNDKVLLKINEIQTKFQPLWEGPYMVESKLKNGTYIIKDQNGKKDLVNGDRLKYYHESEHMIPEIVPKSLRSNLKRFK